MTDLVYKTKNTEVDVPVKYDDGKVWFTRLQICTIFSRTRSTIYEHVTNIYKEGIFKKSETSRVYRVFSDKNGSKGVRSVEFFDSEIVKEIGKRVRSADVKHFREWEIDFLTKMENKKKNTIQEIRLQRKKEKDQSKELRKVFVSSADYSANSEESREFFKNVQNLFHHAVTGRTANEIVVERINGSLFNLGMISFDNQQGITKKDAYVAKNYLNKDEITLLYKLSSHFLTYIEIKAIKGKIMNMGDWISELSKFLRFHDFELPSGECVSREKRDIIVDFEYKRFKESFGNISHNSETKYVQRELFENKVELTT